MAKFWKNRYLLFLVGIISLAAFLRFFLLGVNPPSLNWDEASIGYNAYSILKTGADEYGNKMPLSFRSFDDFKPPVYVYLAVPSVAVFGLTEFAVRLPAAIIGVFTVIVVYYFVKEIFDKWDKKTSELIALASAFFMAISPWHLQFSRAAFEGNVGMFFLILAVFSFFKGLNDKRFYLIFVLGFVLSLYSYHSFRLINPIILIALLGFHYKELVKQKFPIVLSVAAIILFSFTIFQSFFMPQGTGARLSMVTVFSDPQIQKLSAEKVLEAKQKGDILGQIIYNRRLVFIPTVVNGYFDHFNFDFLFLHGDSGVQHHAYNMGMLYLFEFPFILLGLLILFKSLDKRILTLLVIFFLAPLPSAITTGTPHPVRAIAMIPAFHIFTAVGLVCCFKLINKIKKPAVIIISVLFIINIGYYLYSYYVLTPIRYGYFWQYGYKEAFAYAKHNETRFDKIYVTYEYDQPYIYYLFYNKIDPSWYQKHWQYSKDGSVDRFFRVIGKYEFKKIEYGKDIQSPNSLIISAPNEVPENVNVKKEIRFPDGRVAFKIIET